MYRYITSLEDALKSLEIINKCPYVGLDIETRGLDCFTDEILLIQIACDEYFTEEPISTFVYDARLIDLREFFDQLKISVIGHNLQFDLKFIRYLYNWFPETLFDTMIAESLITNGIGKQMPSLNDLCFKYLGQTLVKEIRDTFQDQIAFFTDQQLNYAADDAEILLKLYTILQTELLNKELTKASELEFELLPVIVDMELRGVNFSKEVWAKCLEQAKEGLKIAESKIRELIVPLKFILVDGKSKGQLITKKILVEDINLNSPAQVLNLLHKVKIRVKNTQEETLNEYVDDPLVKVLLEYRGFQRKISTYGESYYRHINLLTNRIHPEFNQIGAQSSRLSSNNPNAQNVPNPYKDPNETINYRKAFIPTDGYSMIVADYSQQELRVAAHYSQEPKFIQTYKEKGDLHRKTAARINHCKPEEVTKDQRTRGKNTEFAILYQSGPGNISRKFKIPFNEAVRIIEDFKDEYPYLAKWIEQSNQEVILKGYSTNLIGFRRYFQIPSFNNPKFDIELGAIKREGTNHRIQSTSAAITKKAMILCYKSLKEIGGHLLMTVHDELVCEVPLGMEDKGKQIVNDTMCQAFEWLITDVSIEVDVHSGNCWEK